MSRSVTWTDRARKDLERLDRRTRERVLSAVEEFARIGHGDVKKLQAQAQPTYRLRVGEWRVFFLLETQLLILVLRVRPRGDAYS